MSGQDLYLELQKLLERLERALVALPRWGKVHAQAEHDYRVAMAKRTLELRSEGYPVGVIADLVRGDERIAKLRFERDVALTVYEAAQETIRVWKLESTLMESQIAREWGRRD